MSSGITAHIRLKEHLRLFYSSTGGDSTHLKIKRQFFNLVIHSALELRTDFVHTKIDADKYYIFELPNYADKHVAQGNYYIPEKYYNAIENQLELCFDMSYYNHIIGCDHLHEAIYGFCRIHGMPISDKLFEMLKKRYYRARKQIIENQKQSRKNYKKNSNALSLICPQVVTC